MKRNTRVAWGKTGSGEAPVSKTSNGGLNKWPLVQWPTKPLHNGPAGGSTSSICSCCNLLRCNCLFTIILSSRCIVSEMHGLFPNIFERETWNNDCGKTAETLKHSEKL